VTVIGLLYIIQLLGDLTWSPLQACNGIALKKGLPYLVAALLQYQSQGRAIAQPYFEIGRWKHVISYRF